LNLLLFLSAILSALTGVISGGRVADVQVERSYGGSAEARAGATVSVAPIRAVRSWLARASEWPLAAAATFSRVPATAPFESAPIYLSKPRE
jgi:hypothetical protein